MVTSDSKLITASIILFRAHLTRLHKSPLTTYAYGRDMELLALWFEENHLRPMEISDLTRDLVDNYYYQRNFPTQNKRRVESALRAFCRSLHANSIPVPLDQNIHPTDDHALTEEEITRLMEVAGTRAVNQRSSSPTRTRLILALFLECITAPEIVELTVSDVTREGLLAGCSPNGKRLVPLFEETRLLLDQWLLVRKEIIDDQIIASSDLLLPRRPDGEPMTSRAILRLVDRVAQEAGVPATPRRLRLTCIHRLCSQQVPNEVIAERLGRL